MGKVLDIAPVARLEFVEEDSHQPGWHIQYSVDGRETRDRLAIDLGVDAFGAVEFAAAELGCSPEQIEVHGPFWPKPLDGLVPAEETLEWISGSELGAPREEGEWRLVRRLWAAGDPDPRRSPRRLARGVLLDSPLPGRVIDLSKTGIGIEIRRPLRILSREVFTYQSGQSPPTQVAGVVRWCRLANGLHSAAEETSLYRAGIALVNANHI